MDSRVGWPRGVVPAEIGIEPENLRSLAQRLNRMTTAPLASGSMGAVWGSCQTFCQRQESELPLRAIISAKLFDKK